LNGDRPVFKAGSGKSVKPLSRVPPGNSRDSGTGATVRPPLRFLREIRRA
jgi:hypothetical protein